MGTHTPKPGGTPAKVIQDNGDRHYRTDHGVYVIRQLDDSFYYGGKRIWEIFAPPGLNFNTAHSLLESSLKDAKSHIGFATTNCDDQCGCEFAAKAARPVQRFHRTNPLDHGSRPIYQRVGWDGVGIDTRREEE